VQRQPLGMIPFAKIWPFRAAFAFWRSSSSSAFAHPLWRTPSRPCPEAFVLRHAVPFRFRVQTVRGGPAGVNELLAFFVDLTAESAKISWPVA
jgi:hypothetical protein